MSRPPTLKECREDIALVKKTALALMEEINDLKVALAGVIGMAMLYAHEYEKAHRGEEPEPEDVDYTDTNVRN